MPLAVGTVLKVFCLEYFFLFSCCCCCSFCFCIKSTKSYLCYPCHFCDARLRPNQLMAMRTTHSKESTQAKLYMYLAVPIKYYTLIWSSWAVELNNETASVSLDSLLLQCLTTNERNIDTYFFVGTKCKHYFSMCIKTNVTAYILTVWLTLMAIISAFLKQIELIFFFFLLFSALPRRTFVFTVKSVNMDTEGTIESFCIDGCL